MSVEFFCPVCRSMGFKHKASAALTLGCFLASMNKAKPFSKKRGRRLGILCRWRSAFKGLSLCISPPDHVSNRPKMDLHRPPVAGLHSLSWHYLQVESFLMSTSQGRLRRLLQQQLQLWVGLVHCGLVWFLWRTYAAGLQEAAQCKLTNLN